MTTAAPKRPFKVTVVGGQSVGTFTEIAKATARAREWVDEHPRWPAFIKAAAGSVEVSREQGGGYRLTTSGTFAQLAAVAAILGATVDGAGAP